MKFYIIFCIIFATLIHRSTCKYFGTWQKPPAGIKGTTAYGGIGTVTRTAPTCTATQLAAMDTQIQTALMNYLMTMVVTDPNAFIRDYITQTLTTLEARRAANALVAVNMITAMVLTPALMTTFTTFGQGLQTTALQTAINAAITNNVDCAVCVPDRARINSVINAYLTGPGVAVLSTALEPALANGMVTAAFNNINTAANFPLINMAQGGYSQAEINQIRMLYTDLLSTAATRTTIANAIIPGINTSLMTAVTNGVIGNLIDAAVAMCTTITVAAATPTAFNTNLCAVAAINGGTLVSWQQKMFCLFSSLIG